MSLSPHRTRNFKNIPNCVHKVQGNHVQTSTDLEQDSSIKQQLDLKLKTEVLVDTQKTIHAKHCT